MYIPPSRGKHWRVFSALLGIAISTCIAAGQTPPGRPNASPPPPASAAANAMDEPLRLIGAARQAYQGVRDYSCLFVKRERIRGQLQAENLVALKARTQPFSVYLRWLGPKQFAGQEACYVVGRNNGMMRAKSNGLLGAVGFVSLDPRDPRALENSRHSITEAGIGNLIERYSQGWELDRRANRTQVRVAEYDYNKRRCTRVEAIHLENAGGSAQFYRNIVYFDLTTYLPIRVENYDWPRQGGTPGGDLLEEYSYVDLRLNVGLGDRDFSY